MNPIQQWEYSFYVLKKPHLKLLIFKNVNPLKLNVLIKIFVTELKRLSRVSYLTPHILENLPLILSTPFPFRWGPQRREGNG